MQPSITPEPERARRVRHAHALADAAGLRELDVDPVRDLRAGGDVGERVAVLVDVDRDRRARFSSAPPGSPAGSGCSQYWTPSSASCGRYSSDSSSVHASLTSTWSGTSVTPRTARTRSASSPSRAPSLSFSRWNRPATSSARRPMSSGSPSQIVHEVGGPVRGRPEQAPDGLAGELPAEVVERAVDRRLRRLLAGALGEARADLLERERVVAEQRLDLVEERQRRGRRLAVALDRRRLAVARHVAVLAARPARRRRCRPTRARSRTSRAAPGSRSGRSASRR